METGTVKPSEEITRLAHMGQREERTLHVLAYPKNVAVGYDRDRFEWSVEVHEPDAPLGQQVRTVYGPEIDANGYELGLVARAVRDSLLFAGGVGTKVCSYPVGTTPEKAGLVEVSS